MEVAMNTKMTIRSFSDPQFESEMTDIGPFVVHVNPQTYTKTTVINFAEEQAAGTSSSQGNHDKTEPVKLSFDFLLDRTGALGNESNEENGVEKVIFKIFIFLGNEEYDLYDINFSDYIAFNSSHITRHGNSTLWS